jgi:hypothetical protein
MAESTRAATRPQEAEPAPSLKPSPLPPRIFLAGYQRGDLAAAVFPGVPTHCYFPSAAPLTSQDVLIVGMHGPARCGEFDPASCLYPGKSCSGSVDKFPGPVLYYNGEPHGRLTQAQINKGHVYYLGPLAAERESEKEMRVFHFALTVMVPFIEREGLGRLVASHRFQRNTRQHFMACVHTPIRRLCQHLCVDDAAVRPS